MITLSLKAIVSVKSFCCLFHPLLPRHCEEVSPQIITPPIWYEYLPYLRYLHFYDRPLLGSGLLGGVFLCFCPDANVFMFSVIYLF